MPAPAVKARPELARDLGVSHAGAIVVGTIIGSGIFLVPSEMMQAVGSAKLHAEEQARLLGAAEILLGEHPEWGRNGVRFDVIAVDSRGRIRRVKDALRLN